MKKLIAAVCLLISVLLIAGGCSGIYAGMEKNSLDITWNALDSEVRHDELAYTDANGNYTGGQAVGDTWDTNWIVSNQRCTVSCRVDGVAVSRGFYRFSAEFSTNDNLVSQATQENFDIIGELRVYDEDGNNVAYREIGRYEVKQAGVFDTYSVTFPVERNTKLNVFFTVRGNVYVKAKSLHLESISASEHIVPDYYEILKSDGETVSYQDNALYYFDLYRYLRKVPTTVAQYDLATMVFAIQGFANRDGQRLYVNFFAPNWLNGGTDTYWLEELTKPGNELANKTVVEVQHFETLLKLFADYINGVVSWDEEVPATYNTACTAAGVENLLPVRYSESPYSLYSVMVNDFGLEDKISLDSKFTGSGKVWGTNVRSSGSKKCDAYIWARETYLRPGKTNPLLMGQHLDAYTSDWYWPEEYGEKVMMYESVQQQFLPNKDYLFAKKAFFWDLSPWEAPSDSSSPDYSQPYDDMDQPRGTDFKTLQSILELQNKLAGDNIISVSGFPAWFVPKYSACNGLRTDYPEAVALEWRFSDLLGYYNMGTHGDAYGVAGQGPLTNASVFMHIPQKSEYTQPGDKTKQYLPENQVLENVNYVVMFMGDYDSAAWCNEALLKTYFNDPMRGELPLCWPIIPQVNERVPHIISRMYDAATPNDYFVGGDIGYIYGNPESLIDPNRPKASDGSELNGTIESYKQRTIEEFKKYDIDIMGFLLTSTYPSDTLEKTYAEITPTGIMMNFTREPSKTPRNLVDYKGTPDNYDDDVPVTTLLGAGTQGDSAEMLAYYINSQLDVPTGPTFTAFRSILASPTDLVYAFNQVDARKNVKVVDPYTYFNLLKQYSVLQATRSGGAA